VFASFTGYFIVTGRIVLSHQHTAVLCVLKRAITWDQHQALWQICTLKFKFTCLQYKMH